MSSATTSEYQAFAAKYATAYGKSEFPTMRDFYHWAKSNGWAGDCRVRRLDTSKPFSPDNCIVLTSSEDDSGLIKSVRAYEESRLKFMDILAKSSPEARERWLRKVRSGNIWPYVNQFPDKEAK